MTAICFCIKEHPIPRPYSHCVSQELNSEFISFGTMEVKILMVVIILAEIIAVSLGQSEGEMVKVNECNTQCVVQ